MQIYKYFFIPPKKSFPPPPPNHRPTISDCGRGWYEVGTDLVRTWVGVDRLKVLIFSVLYVFLCYICLIVRKIRVFFN